MHGVMHVKLHTTHYYTKCGLIQMAFH